MCNKKERKRDRRWYLFPVSTLGAVYFAVHGGTGRFVCFFEAGRGGFFFSEAGRGGFFFFRGGTGWLFFFFSTGRDGAVFFFFFRGPGRDGYFWRWQFFWLDGAKSLHRPTKGGLNRPASRPCKALENRTDPALKHKFNVFCEPEHPQKHPDKNTYYVYRNLSIICVRYNGGFLPDILLLALRYYHRGTPLNAMERFYLCSLCSHLLKTF